VTVLKLTADQDRLVAEYGAALRDAGLRCDKALVWGGRSFFARFGSIEAWQQAPLERQLALNVKLHRFIAWLLATHRAAAPAAYLIARRPQFGRVVAAHHPVFFAEFCATATALGFPRHAVAHQWAVLCQVCAVHAVPPEELTHEQLDAARCLLTTAGAGLGKGMRALRSALFHLEATLFHAQVTDSVPRRRTPDKASERAAEWDRIAARAPRIAETAARYLEQIALTLRPGTVRGCESVLREFASFVIDHGHGHETWAHIKRADVEAYKAWLSQRPAQRSARLHRHTIRERLGKLRGFFERALEWGWEDVPHRVPVFGGDFPVADERLPRFLDDAAAAKLLVAARADPDPFNRLTVEFLARTGLRKGEYLALTVDAVVQIGSAYWLRVPVGKLHNDRYIPLHPQLKALLDEWLAHRPSELRSNLMFIHRGRPIPPSRVDRAVATVARAAGIGHVSPHQLRHTLATQAVNRGMSLEAIAALLGHRSLRMTLVYARIADRTVADEYFAVSQQVEALYDRPRELPAAAEGNEMTRLRKEMQRRMLGNGYCARPVELDCHFESICESCSFFVTTEEFRPTLERQRDDAIAKGQV
jgi:integrase